MQVTDDEREALESIRATYEYLDRWRVRSRSVERPEPGSDLAGDETISPHLDPAEIVRHSLISATQHLNLARAALENGQVFPTAHYSVLRGALVGSSMAVWILGPDTAVDRQQRALRLIHEFYQRALEHHDELRPYTDESHPGHVQSLDAADHMRTRMSQAREKWTSATGLGKDEPLRVTKIVRAAAESVFSVQEALEVRLLWRQLSGDAHALGWQMLARSGPPRRVGRGMAEFAAGGDLADLADVFDKFFRLTRRGWSLFDRRCEAQS